MLELININKNYNPGSVNELCLFKDFNLTVKDGEFVSVVGSNGSGKTSMLNIICGSIAVDSGKILIHGEILRDRRIIFVSVGSAESIRILPREPAPA